MRGKERERERGGGEREGGGAWGEKEMKDTEREKREIYYYSIFFSSHCFSFRDPTDPAEPPRVETLTYQAVLQNELLGKNITEVPVR